MDVPRVGLVLAILGTLGCLRLCPEIAVAFEHGPPNLVYLLIVFLDQILALTMVVAGVGLRKEKPWAPGLAVMVAGPLLVTSIGMGLLIVPEIVASAAAQSGRSEAVALAPRIFYYIVNVVLWPFALRRIIRGESPADRRSLWAFFVLWIFLGLVVMGILLLGMKVFR